MSRTMVIKSGHPPSFAAMGDLYPIQEHSVDDLEIKTTRPSTKLTTIRPSTAGSVYPVYSGLKTPGSSDRHRSTDSPPMMLNRPRKLANNPTSAKRPTYSREQSKIGAKPPLRKSTTEGGSNELNSRIPSQFSAQPSRKLSRAKVQAKPDELFASLPGEVLELILENLKLLHLSKRSDSCATCWMRDLCSLSLTCRRWSKFAQAALYEDIQLIGSESTTQKKKSKMTHASRLMLLRRTLRACPPIAAIVRSLKVPLQEFPALVNSGKNMSAVEQYENNVAAVVMACPNLERLVGPMSSYDHSFKRLFHALSTREKLKEMNWELVASNSQEMQQSDAATPQKGKAKPAEINSSEAVLFLEHHRNWAKLTTLTIHCLPNATLAPSRLFSETLNSLTSLQELHLCNVPSDTFNDASLLSLPRLQTLSLLYISGITSSGLSSFATLPNSRCLKTLHLRHTPLTSLAALARIFSNLACLESFSLAQDYSPVMPETDSFILWMMPYLASASIKTLHWDIAGHTNSMHAADSILTRSIEAGGFPALRRLRTPNDPDGVFQALCRPVEKISLPTDPFRRGSTTESTLRSTPSSPNKRLQKSSTTTSLPSMPSRLSTPGSSLVEARLAAQMRLETARGESRIRVNVTGEGGELVDVFGLGGYIGTIGSDIEYHLHPDDGATDENGGLIDLRHLRDDAEERLAEGREGCTGRWNWSEGDVADRKEKERWWHTERGRWSRVDLS